MEAWCSDGDSLVGLTIPRPPSLAGKAKELTIRVIWRSPHELRDRVYIRRAQYTRRALVITQFNVNAARAQVSRLRLCRSISRLCPYTRYAARACNYAVQRGARLWHAVSHKNRGRSTPGRESLNPGSKHSTRGRNTLDPGSKD